LKVAILLGSLNQGGSETLILDTLNNLDRSDLEIYCIYRSEGLLSNDFRETGARLVRIAPKGKWDLLYIWRLRKYLRKSQINIAHAQQSVDALYAWLACLGLKTKVLFTMHGYDFKFGNATKRIIRFIHRRTSLNIFVSKTQRDYFIDKYNFKLEKTRVLYNGVCFDKFDKFKYFSIREEFNIPEQNLLLGMVGNFNPARDQMTICRFLDLLNQKDVEFTFVFAGSQSKAAPWFWDDCQRFIQEKGLSGKVIFAGPRYDVPNFNTQLDAFLYATDHDTFGIAVIEAMSKSIPVFINDWKVFLEITDNGKHAIVFKSKNEKDLLIQFLNFLDNMDKFRQKAKQDADWVRKQYSIQTHIKNLRDIYRNALSA
jgi:glycosyltransferase involved in cell wall biosynthesis